jgi:sugar phosphate isomerase/epimerase
MKIGVSSYCFQRLYKEGQFTLFDAIDYARKTGFDAIEFTALTPPAGRSLEDFAGETGRAVQQAGLEVSCYAVGADFLAGSNGDIKQETERVKGCVDIAKIMGAPILGHDAAWGLKDTTKARSWRDAIRLISPAIREVTEYAAALGMRTMTENHGYFIQDSARMEELVLAVNHPNYGLLADMGNFMCADETSVNALAAVIPYAFHIHAKDFLWKSGAEGAPDNSWFPTRAGNYLRGTILGHGVVSAGQCIQFIKKSGYEGTISLEFEGPEEPLEAVRRGYEYLKARV